MQQGTERRPRVRWLRLAAKVFATTLVVVSLAYTVDFASLWSLLRSSKVSLLWVAVGITLLVNLIKPLRWLLLLRSVAPSTSYKTALRSHLVSVGARLLLPGKVGEFGRAVGLPNVELKTGLYLAGLDVLLEVLITSAIAIPGLYLLFGWLGALALALPWAVLVVSVLRQSARSSTVAEPASSPTRFAWLKKLKSALHAAARGIRVVGQLRLLTGLWMTLGIAGLRLLQLATLVVSLGGAVNLTFAALYPVIQLADAIPLTVGGIGVREWVGVQVLPMGNISVEAAAAAIFLQYLITNLLPGLVGWVVLLKVSDEHSINRPSWLR